MRLLKKRKEGFSELALSPLIDEPLRYDGILKTIQIKVGNSERVRIKHTKDTLEITGSPEKMRVLAKNISFLVNQAQNLMQRPVKDHIHLEYYLNHPLLDSESQPLVINVFIPGRNDTLNG